VAGGEKGVLRPGYRGLIGDAGSRGKEKGTAAVKLIGGAEGDGARCGGEVVPWRGGVGPGSAGSSV
jgi:hypothetical protein